MRHNKISLIFLGLPKEKAENYINSKPTQKIEKDGDGYVLTTTTGHGVTEMRFKPGVEFEQKFTPEIVVSKETLNHHIIG